MTPEGNRPPSGRLRLDSRPRCGFRVPRRGCLRLVGLLVLSLVLFSHVSGAAPRRGGVLRLARVNDPATLDPGTVSSMVDVMLLPLLFQPVIDFQGGAILTNRLCRSWSSSPDMRVFTFELLPGVRFSNGREVTTQDYVFTLGRSVRIPSFLQPYALQIKGASNFLAAHQIAESVPGRGVGQGGLPRVEQGRLAGVTTPSPLTLVVELDKPDPTFPAWMANSFGMALAAETMADPLKDVGKNPVGTGPYRVREWIRGVRLVYEPNPYYFRPEEQHFDSIEILVGGDESTHLMMFERGELDMASLQPTGAPEADWMRLHTDPRWREGFTNSPMFHAVMINLNHEMPPLDDARVRLAIAHAIDRDRFQRLNSGRVAPGCGGITPLMPGFNAALRPPGFDPEKSRALLREAGYGRGLPRPLRFCHTNIQLYRRWAAAIQEDLARAGITVELQEVSQGVFDVLTGRRRGVEMAMFAWTAGTPDASYFLLPFHSRFISDESSQNSAFHSDPRIDRLLDAAGVEPRVEQRLGMYREVEKMLVDRASLIVLGHQNLFALRQPWLKGPILEPLWWFRLDRVWAER